MTPPHTAGEVGPCGNCQEFTGLCGAASLTVALLATGVVTMPDWPHPHCYRDRVLLLKPLHVWPVCCRFSFRREAVGPAQGLLGEKELARAID